MEQRKQGCDFAQPKRTENKTEKPEQYKQYDIQYILTGSAWRHLVGTNEQPPLAETLFEFLFYDRLRVFHNFSCAFPDREQGGHGRSSSCRRVTTSSSSVWFTPGETSSMRATVCQVVRKIRPQGVRCVCMTNHELARSLTGADAKPNIAFCAP